MHLDLLPGFDRLRILEPDVLVAFLQRGRLRGGRQRQGHDEHRQQRRQTAHQFLQQAHVRILHRQLTFIGLHATTRVPGLLRSHAAAGRWRSTHRSELDHGDVEAALGELALHPGELVGIVVGAEANAVTHALVRQARGLDRGFPSREREPRLQILGVGLVARTSPPAARIARRPSPSCRPGAAPGARRLSPPSCPARRRDRRSPCPPCRDRRSSAELSAPPRPAGSCRNRTAASPRHRFRHDRTWPGPSPPRVESPARARRTDTGCPPSSGRTRPRQQAPGPVRRRRTRRAAFRRSRTCATGRRGASRARRGTRDGRCGRSWCGGVGRGEWRHI